MLIDANVEKEIGKIETVLKKVRFRQYMCDKCNRASDKTMNRDIRTLAERMYENGIRTADTGDGTQGEIMKGEPDG